MLSATSGYLSSRDWRFTVDDAGTQALFSSIDTLLFCSRETSACGEARGIWAERPRISTEEIGMWMDLMKEPRCAAHVAGLLGRDVAGTKRLLDGMVSIGILDVLPEGYSPTTATRLYCGAVLGGTLPA